MSTPPLTWAPVNAAETTAADERPPSPKLTAVFPGVGSGDSSLAPASSSNNAKEVKIEFKGWDLTEKMTPERAIRKGFLTIEEGVKKGYFTLDDAQTNGWVSVTIARRMWDTSTIMLQTAVEEGYMTVEQAIDAGHITKEQAAKADWIQKK